MRQEYCQVYFRLGKMVEIYAFNIRDAAIIAMSQKLQEGNCTDISYIKCRDHIYNFGQHCPLCWQKLI